MALINKINDGFAALTNLVKSNKLAIADNKVLLPKKIGAAQKWYQSGLRHGADYPRPYTQTTNSAVDGRQYFVPFTALEDATITALEIHCTAAVAKSTVSLGICASDSNNDLANPLFTSSPISCATTGPKNAPCKVQIKKGKVYWLSSFSINPTSSQLVFYCNAPDSLFPLKGTVAASHTAAIGYYTMGNTSMAQSTPTNKIEVLNYVPRVMFVVA